MPLIEYVETRFNKYSLHILHEANKVIIAWQAKGYRLTLRQIYYRLIATDKIPDSWIDEVYNKAKGLAPRTKNTIRNYKRLGDILNSGRIGGKVDWDAMEDRTRNLLGLQHWDSPEDGLKWLAEQYRIEKWKDGQKYRVEVWIEKDALLGIFERVCCEPNIDVQYFSCRGYNSQSEMWGASQRILYYERERKQQTIILQFSDHDPSGVDMTRDIRARLKMFGCNTIIKRLGLTIEQVRKFKLPPNPAKENDIRFAGYAEKFGNDSWELDALEPDVLASLVRNAVLRIRNKVAWNAALEVEAQQKARILSFATDNPDGAPSKKLRKVAKKTAEPKAEKIRCPHGKGRKFVDGSKCAKCNGTSKTVKPKVKKLRCRHGAGRKPVKGFCAKCKKAAPKVKTNPKKK